MHSETTTTVNGLGEVTQMGGFIGCFSGGGSASIGSLTCCRLEKANSAARCHVCRGAPWDKNTTRSLWAVDWD